MLACNTRDLAVLGTQCVENRAYKIAQSDYRSFLCSVQLIKCEWHSSAKLWLSLPILWEDFSMNGVCNVFEICVLWRSPRQRQGAFYSVLSVILNPWLWLSPLVFFFYLFTFLYLTCLYSSVHNAHRHCDTNEVFIHPSIHSFIHSFKHVSLSENAGSILTSSTCGFLTSYSA